jgi:hypothetical protein
MSPQTKSFRFRPPIAIAASFLGVCLVWVAVPIPREPVESLLRGAHAATAGATSGGGAEAIREEVELDLDALIKGLTKTRAIGLFSKLSDKGEAEELMKAVSSYHEAGGNPTLEQLRERYDLLVNKVLVMLQGKDEPLAQSISGARELLWTDVSDPVRFARLNDAI